MYTTTHDVRALWNNLFSYSILSEELTTVYLETHSVLDATNGYGCGVFKRLDDSMFAMVGGDAGVGFDSRYFVQDGLVINILSNITGGDEYVKAFVLSWITR
jgi:hypothetical protein